MQSAAKNEFILSVEKITRSFDDDVSAKAAKQGGAADVANDKLKQIVWRVEETFLKKFNILVAMSTEAGENFSRMLHDEYESLRWKIEKIHDY